MFQNIYERKKKKNNNFSIFSKTFSIIALLARSNSWSLSDIAYNAVI